MLGQIDFIAILVLHAEEMFADDVHNLYNVHNFYNVYSLWNEA